MLQRVVLANAIQYAFFPLSAISADFKSYIIKFCFAHILFNFFKIITKELSTKGVLRDSYQTILSLFHN